MLSSPAKLLIIYNPASGGCNAASFTEAHIVPLISPHYSTKPTVIATQHPGHAATIIQDYLSSQSDNDQTNSDNEIRALDVVLVSGDGTLHELINAHASTSEKADGVIVNLALVPGGTANALYHAMFRRTSDGDDAHESTEYMLRSVHALCEARKRALGSDPQKPSSSTPDELKALRIARTLFTPRDGERSVSSSLPSPISSAVVVSTSLHASILYRSEDLRATIPGIERFKVAAAENITRWYNAKVKLFGIDTEVSVYDSSSKTFRAASNTKEVELDGPFTYFLSTTVVDRLESKFVISPLQTRIPPPSHDGSREFLDVVIVRPLRDPSISHIPDDGPKDEKTRSEFSKRMIEVLGAAYNNGAHVDVLYDTGNEGREVVEYFRCAGWEWTPDPSDEMAHLVCTDGAITRIPKGGKAVCETIPGGGADGPQFKIYV